MRLRRRELGAFVMIILLMLAMLALVGGGIQLARGERAPLVRVAPLAVAPPIDLPISPEPAAAPDAKEPAPVSPSRIASPPAAAEELAPAPSPPQDLRAEAGRDGHVLLTWRPTPGSVPVAFAVRRDDELVHEGVETRYVDRGVRAPKRHCWEVRALDTAMRQSAPASACASPLDVTPPPVPLSVVARLMTRDSVELSWPASEDDAGAVTYDVLGHGRISTVTETSWTESGLAPAREYCYAVRATDASGNQSAPSPRVCITTAPLRAAPTPDPAPVTLGDRDLSATVYRRSVRLVWRRSEEKDVIYRVYTSDGKVVGATAGNTFEHTRIDGATQCYRIRTMDRDGRESPPTRPICVPAETFSSPTLSSAAH